MDIVTWPVVGLVLGLVGMFVFRSPLVQLIGRTQRIGKDILLASPQQSNPAPDDKSAIDEFLKSYDNPLLRDQETIIRKDIADRGLAGHADLEKVLIRTLAATQILAHFERAYSAIWDSQLALLRHLNTVENGVPMAFIKNYFDAVVEHHPRLKGQQDLTSYLGYLEAHTLIRHDGDHVSLTVAGREFLKWLVETGKSDRGMF